MTAPQIYLIEAEIGLVKIGRAQNVGDRLQVIRTHSPVLTRLIAKWDGGEPEEIALHERFQIFRKLNEWFEYTGEFARFVDESRGLGVLDIPNWQELRFSNRNAFQKRRARLVREVGEAASIARPRREFRSTTAGLTKRQNDFLQFITTHISEKGYSPSFQEIADEFGLVSKSGVHRYVHSLVERGHIFIEPNLGRSICLPTASPSVGA